MTYFDWGDVRNPPASYWLPQFAPGEIENMPITGYPVKTPSLSLWNKTPWSQKQGLESYINKFAGVVPGMVASFEDLLTRIEMMRLARSPYGAGQWAVARQW